MKVAEGQSTEITCEVTGKPDPIITWYRDKSLITGGRFKILPTGNLHIEACISFIHGVVSKIFLLEIDTLKINLLKSYQCHWECLFTKLLLAIKKI